MNIEMETHNVSRGHLVVLLDAAALAAHRRMMDFPDGSLERVCLEDAWAEGRAAIIAETSAILDACAAAGMPQLAKGFIDAGTPLAKVRVRLDAQTEVEAARAAVLSTVNNQTKGI